MTPSYPWTVTDFDENTLRGTVHEGSPPRSGGRRLRFHSTSFQCDTSFRWPRVGEVVEVAFTFRDELLSVHGK